MKHTLLFLSVIGVILLLLSLFSIGSTDVHLALQATITPTAYNYLPLVSKNWPPMPPSAPVLHPIDNTDGDHRYQVNWDSVPGATAYWLDVDDDAQFGTPNVAYIGTSPAKQFAFQRMGSHFYRVRARNDVGSSDWSNTASATVTSPPPHYLIGEIDWGLQSCRWNLGVHDETGPVTLYTYYWLRKNNWGLCVHHWDVNATWSSSGNTYSGTVECWMHNVPGVGSYYTGMFEFTGGHFGGDAAQASDTDYP